MSDQDFNFNPPPRREAKKPFEPPPWEQEQFEDLARRREEQRAAQDADPVVEMAGQEVALTGSAGSGGSMGSSDPADDTQPSKSPVGAPKTGTTLEDDPRIEAMMAGLRSEEPTFGAEMWKGSVAAGFVLALVGVVLVVWGVFAASVAKRTGALGLLGGGILVVFGLLFAGVGTWLVYRTLRQRGVL